MALQRISGAFKKEHTFYLKGVLLLAKRSLSLNKKVYTFLSMGKELIFEGSSI